MHKLFKRLVSGILTGVAVAPAAWGQINMATEEANIRTARSVQTNAIAVQVSSKWLIRSGVFVALTCADNACKFPSAP